MLAQFKQKQPKQTKKQRRLKVISLLTPDSLINVLPPLNDASKQFPSHQLNIELLHSIILFYCSKYHSMLSYRHAFHAGNHADVLKHYVFSLVLDYFNQKEKPYWVVDTHAGSGVYALDKGYAKQNAEFESGIARLYTAENLPESLKSYVETIKKLNENNSLTLYPGSPYIAKHFLRRDDKLWLFELHPSDYKLLLENFMGENKSSTRIRQTKIEMLDGFAGLKSCMPPASKRGVVLIDPPYELKEDYQHVVSAIKDTLTRFATGTYLVWYPLLQRPEPLNMVSALKSLCPNNYLDVTLSVQTPAADGFGMFGSGMLIINPPWTLPKIIKETMPYLIKALAQDDDAEFTLTSQIT